MRLIDADALTNAHIECPEHISFFDFGEVLEMFLQTVDEQPTINTISMREWNLLRNSIQELQENNPEKKDIQFVTKFLLRLMDISERRDKNEV